MCRGDLGRRLDLGVDEESTPKLGSVKQRSTCGDDLRRRVGKHRPRQQHLEVGERLD
jgi:hypothetical protein